MSTPPPPAPPSPKNHFGSKRLSGGTPKKRVTKSKKAGILFPVTRMRNALKEGRYAPIIQTGSAVYLAAVMEYLVAEVLEVSGHVARDHKRHRIIPRHITMAVRNDFELDKVFKHVTISEGGVVPFIHDVLLPKNARRQTESQKSSDNY